MSQLKIFALVFFVVVGANVACAQDRLDTVSFHEAFTETYPEFIADHAVWVVKYRKGWTVRDSLGEMTRVEMDSVYFMTEKVQATSVFLFYEKDTLMSMNFFLSIAEDEKFMGALKRGAFARLGGRGKTRKVKSEGDCYYYQRNLIPADDTHVAEFSYRVYTERLRNKNKQN